MKQLKLFLWVAVFLVILFPLLATDIAESAPNCTEYPAYDFSGPDGEPDCIVDLYDFAVLASHWLECSLIPESACLE